MKFFILRHGETPWNVQGRFQGRNDIPLNDKGQGQARAASRALQEIPFDAFWASPLSRALDTARAVAGPHAGEIRTHEGLLEISHGLWEGLLACEVEERWPGVLERWHRAPHTVTMPEGETLLDVQARALRAVDSMRRAGGETVLMAAHDAVIKVLLCAWMEMPLHCFWRFQIGNGSLTIVEDSPTGLRMSLMGDTCHLGNPFHRPDQAGL